MLRFTMLRASILTVLGSGDMQNRTRSSRARGKVAEKSQVALRDLVSSIVSLIWSLKPMLSISSASSRMRVCTWLRLIALRSRRSHRRPGVATTMWVGRCSLEIWTSILSPPARTSAKMRWSAYFVNLKSAL